MYLLYLHVVQKCFKRRLHHYAIYFDSCKGLIILHNDSVYSELCGIQAASKYLNKRSNSDVIPKFQLTAEAPVWDPGLSSYSLQEDSILDFRGQIVNTVTTTRGQIMMQVNAVCSSLFASYCVIDTIDNDNFGIYLESFVQISLTRTSRRAAISHNYSLGLCKGHSIVHYPKGCMYDSKSCLVQTFPD